MIWIVRPGFLNKLLGVRLEWSHHMYLEKTRKQWGKEEDTERSLSTDVLWKKEEYEASEMEHAPEKKKKNKKQEENNQRYMN